MGRTDIKKGKTIHKILKILGNVIFTIFLILMVGLIFITAQSRLTGREPSIFNHRLYIVNSGSMSPTIQVDSMIVVRESKPEDIKEGDVITYMGMDEHSKITHRVMEVLDDGKMFVTRGDANATDDPLLLEGGRIIGKVVIIIPLMGIVFKFLSSAYGIASLAILGIFWLVIPMVTSKKGKHHRQNKESLNVDDSH